MVTTCEVIRGMGEIIATIEGMVIEMIITIGIGVGHLKDRIEVGEMIEVQVTVGLCQALGQVQIDRVRCFKCREYDHFAGNVQQGKRVGRQSKYNICLIWMKTRQYYRFR